MTATEAWKHLANLWANPSFDSTGRAIVQIGSYQCDTLCSSVWAMDSLGDQTQSQMATTLDNYRRQHNKPEPFFPKNAQGAKDRHRLCVEFAISPF